MKALTEEMLFSDLSRTRVDIFVALRYTEAMYTSFVSIQICREVLREQKKKLWQKESSRRTG